MQGSHLKNAAPATLKSGSAYWPGLSLARLVVMLAVAIGYISTMPLGPTFPEMGRAFGYDPSWVGMNVLFVISAYLAMRSLHRHNGAIAMLRSRVERNMPALILFAIIVVAIIFPIFGKPAASLGETLHRLADYMFGVITCTDPGAILPGVLDNAKYPCVIQGAIWTLRWGLIAYIGLAIGWSLGIFKSPLLTLLTAIGVTAAYVTATILTVKGLIALPDQMETGLRLATPFMMGAAAFGYRQKIKARPPVYFALAGIALVLWLLIQYYLMQWTPLIELTYTAVWVCGFVVIVKAFNRLTPQHWILPELALGVFLFHWPIAQLLLQSFPLLAPLELIGATLPPTLLAAYALDRFNARLIQRFAARPGAASTITGAGHV